MAASTGNHNGLNDAVTADLCVVGAGTAGLAVATAAAQLGARTILIDAPGPQRGCTGAVPSKALLAAAQVAETMRHARRFGVNGHPPQIRFADIHAHLRGVLDGIADHGSTQRFSELGGIVLAAPSRFIARNVVQAGAVMVQARRFVLATGSRPLVPDLPGLAGTAYFTSDTILDNEDCPEHLIILGGGRAACELAQAHRRLGARVTLLARTHILAADDPELTAVVKMQLLAEGVAIHEEVAVSELRRRDRRIIATFHAHGARQELDGSHLLIACGRAANMDGLGLDAAGVARGPGGLTIDNRLRTTNRKIFALGSVAGLPCASHAVAYHAGIVIKNALFRVPARIDSRVIPAVVYTDPELAHVGLSERQARERHSTLRVLRLPFSENVRAQAERRTSGQIKIVASARGEILGASIVGAHAGELLQPWILAIEQRLKLGALARMMSPHPTLGEISTRVASNFFAPALFGAPARRIVRFLSHFG